MKTEHKYISYRPDKDTYIVSLRVDGKKTYFTCHSLEEAIKKRDSLVELHNLDKKIVSSLSTERIVKAIPTLEEAFTEFVEKDVRPRVALSTYSYLLSVYSLILFGRYLLLLYTFRSHKFLNNGIFKKAKNK